MRTREIERDWLSPMKRTPRYRVPLLLFQVLEYMLSNENITNGSVFQKSPRNSIQWAIYKRNGPCSFALSTTNVIDGIPFSKAPSNSSDPCVELKTIH